MAATVVPPRVPALRQIGQPTQWAWRWFCYLVVRAFYRRAEVSGQEHFPAGPVIVCANHPSALADAVIIQAASPRIVHPLARSGLFLNPLARPILAAIQAVPIYRREDAGVDPARNAEAFARCHEMLGHGAALLIFPEGLSHSDPHLRGLKTGAARMALGMLEARGTAPALLPVGLTFTDVGRFRSSVLVKFGRPLAVEARPAAAPLERGAENPESPEEAVQRLTQAIQAGLERVTLNVERWDDLELLRRLERFFWLRRGKYRKRNLEQRFRALRKLLGAQYRLRALDRERVSLVALRLRQFDRLCAHCGVADYHLSVTYTPALVARFVARSLLVVLGGLLPAVWGAVNSLLPFLLTRALAVRLSQDRYQYDTAKITLGIFLFAGFWGAQTVLVSGLLDGATALAYAATLLPCTMLALYFRRERERTLDNLRVFFLFLRRKELRGFLEEKRGALEHELARLVYLALKRPGAGEAGAQPVTPAGAP
jgi:1-acyl-sn-glycerol-3-phosphate acyltransferase